LGISPGAFLVFEFKTIQQKKIRRTSPLSHLIYGASGFSVGGQHFQKRHRSRPLTRTPEPKWKLVVPHERVEAYQGPTALSRNGSTGSPRTGGEGNKIPLLLE
jgi:hypothetical protein